MCGTWIAYGKGMEGNMRKTAKGCFVGVTVSRREVEAFKDRWPCSTLPDRAVYFEFDARNGDLVDMRPIDMDGSDVLALSEDAQRFAGLR